jgi:starch synthase
MKILIGTSEAVPYVKTGGLADVAGTLCKEFNKMGQEAYLILPLYRKIKKTNPHIKDTGISIHVPLGSRIVQGKIFSDALTYFISCDEFFDREELYGTPEGDYGDNAQRFIFFSRAIIETCKALRLGPDIIHCNDWQTGLVPLYLKTLYKDDRVFKKTATLLTIHNLGYQGIFPVSEMPFTNLGWNLFTPEGMEFYGRVNFLKAGIISSDILNTVSHTYSREILTEEHGFRLDGVLRTRIPDLFGIINGIDYDEWNPSKDTFISANYSHDDFSGKAVCKRELIKLLFKSSKKTDTQNPLLGVVGRLSEQKGLDLILGSAEELLSFPVKLVILGKGDERFHRRFSEIAKRYKGMVSVTIGFEEALAHMIYAGSDFFLMPSKYEPCGLGQLIALRYGAIPVARKTGGPADTIKDYNPLRATGTGFLFTDYTSSAMLDALKRAFCIYTDKNKMNKIITEGMNMDFSWRKSAEEYLKIYTIALKRKSNRSISN